MKVLIYSHVSNWEIHHAETIELALKHIDLGDDVYILSCDGALTSCPSNPLHNKFLCISCKAQTKYTMMKILRGQAKDFRLKLRENSIKVPYFSTLEELKALRLYDVPFGELVTSQLVDDARDCYIKVEDIRPRIENLLQNSIALYTEARKIIRESGAEMVYVSNGRRCSDGPVCYAVQARIGTLTADREWFMPWRTIEGEGLADDRLTQLQVLLEGVFEKRRFLNLVRYFIVFEDVGGGVLVKKIAGYHQFHAVNLALESTVKAAGAGGDRRVGVVWHTQGSGKSLTMAFYAGQVVLHTATGWSNNRRCIQIRDYSDLRVYTLAGTISGTVRDSSGTAIAGATVSTSTGGYTTTSGTGGSYTLANVTPGTYTVTASKTGYVSQSVNSVSVSVMQTTPVDFSLSLNSGTITGTVISGGVGLVGATVSTTSGGYTTTTTTGGAYSLSTVAPGTYSVTASKTGYVSATNTNVSVSVGSATTSSFTLTPQPGSITGYVRDSSSAVISGATVSTSTGGYTTTSAANGSYTLSNVTPGSYSVTVSKTGFVSQTNSATVNPGSTVTSNFSLAPLPGSITGYVDAASNGVAGATMAVATGGYTAVSAANSSFTLASVLRISSGSPDSATQRNGPIPLQNSGRI